MPLQDVSVTGRYSVKTNILKLFYHCVATHSSLPIPRTVVTFQRGNSPTGTPPNGDVE